MNPMYGEAATIRYAPEAGSYPVDVQFPISERANRLWALPVVGYYAKALILIPHMLLIIVLEIVCYLLQYVMWIPVLITGRYPAWGHTLYGGTISWRMRMSAFSFGLTDTYPAFGLSDPGTGREAVILFHPQTRYSRFYAVPILGAFIRTVLLIPHMVLLLFFSFVIAFSQLILWIPVIVTGRYPQSGRDTVGGYLRYSTRFYMYALGLTDQYPPFRLGS